MPAEPIDLAVDGAVTTLTVNRPSSLNALDQATLEALRDALVQIGASPARCLIVTGAGDKAFVAGADIAAMRQMTPDEAVEFARLGQAVFAAIEALPIPVIAAVNGFALGGGCELALACDFIHASDKAKFGQPEVKLGVVPGFGGTQRLPRRIGAGLARELIYTGRMLGAEEALRVGLVNAVHPRAELLAEVRKVADAILQVGPGAVANAKRTILEGADVRLGAAMELEAQAFGRCFAGDEQAEGMTAFLDKRTPGFAVGEG